MIRKFQQKSASIEQINKQFNEKRELNWVPLAPPDYLIDSSYLIESFIERECLYVGTLVDISTDIDLKKRAEVLNIIDKGYMSKKLSSPSTDSILSICAKNIKLNQRLFPEPIILRISTEKIISAAYIRDNASHFITVLHQNDSNPSTVPLNGSLTIIKTETSVKAEEICSVITQCFQILYTEATLRHLDRQLYSSISHSGCEYSPDLIMGLQERKHADNVTKIGREEHCALTEIDSVCSDLSASKADLLQTYMTRLQQVLSQDEMKQFAVSLAAWQKGSPFETFCQKAKQLLGSHRISVLADMKYFIDPADRFTLQQFLGDIISPANSMSPYGHWSQLLAKSPLPIPMHRSLSYASTSNGVLSIYDEENSLRDDLSSTTRNNFSGDFVADGNNNADDEFAKKIDSLFQKVGNLDLILTNDR